MTLIQFPITMYDDNFKASDDQWKFMFFHGPVLDDVTGGTWLWGAGPSYAPWRPSLGVTHDLTATLEHFDGISFLSVILEAQRLTGSNTDVSEVPGGEGLPSRARYRLYFYPGSTLQLVLGHVPATCTIPSGQMFVAAWLYQAPMGVSWSALGTWWGFLW